MSKSKSALLKRKAHLRSLMRMVPVMAGGKAAMYAVDRIMKEYDQKENKRNESRN